VEDFGYSFVKLGPVHGEAVDIPIYQQDYTCDEAGEHNAAEYGSYQAGNAMTLEPAGGAHEYEGQYSGEGQGHEDGSGKVEDKAGQDDRKEDRAIIYPKFVHSLDG